MNCYKINGGNGLFGKIKVHGAKNSALPILAATVINGGVSVIHNCPDLSDVSATIEILNLLGCSVCRNGSDVIVDSSQAISKDIPSSAMCRTRASTVFAGALLARFKRAFIAGSGGCSIGTRPIDLHLRAFRDMGIEVSCSERGVLCRGSITNDSKVALGFPSVGATENAMLLASGYNGTTTIYGAAEEPEIRNLADYLRSVGAEVSGDGTSVVTIRGTSRFSDGEVTVIPDRIVASTYAAAVACAGGRVEVEGICPETLAPVLSFFSKMGNTVETSDFGFVIQKTQRCQNVPELKTEPYPGFPTDCQPLAVAALTTADGISRVEEKIFENRFGHCHRLNAMGANIKITGQRAYISGVDSLRGNAVDASDLRCGAALVCAALGAEGTTSLTGACYIERGYESLFSDLISLGAVIERSD